MPLDPADLILAFGQRQQLVASGYKALRDANPHSSILAGSTSGEISNSAVLNENIMAPAVWFDKVNGSGLGEGMNDFAGKPFEPDQLYRKLKSHLVAKKEA